jgi:autotransporter-associated beta strand protein
MNPTFPHLRTRSAFNNFSPRLIAFFAAIIALFFVAVVNNASAQQDIYWRGDTGSTVWWNDTDKPWYYASYNATEVRPDIFPIPTRNRLNFDNNNQTTTTVNGVEFQILSLRIHNNSQARTFNSSSGGAINLSVGYTNDVSFAQTFNVGLVLGGSTVKVSGNTAFNNQFNSTISLGGNKALFGGSSSSASYALAGVVSGAGGQLEVTNGFLVLSGNNTYTGATTITGGTAQVRTNNALGTTAAGTTIASGATLDFQNVNYSTAEGVTTTGGTIAASTGTSTFAGGVTLGADSTYNIAGDQLTQSGVITDGAGTFGITKTGAGFLVLSAANTYDGATTINNGTLVITNDRALGNVPGSPTASSLVMSNTTSNLSALVANETFTLDANRGLSLVGSPSGNQSSYYIAVASGKTLTYNGVITGAGNLVQNQAGILALGGNSSSYGGGIFIDAGTVAFNAGSLGTGATIGLGGVVDGANAATFRFGAANLTTSRNVEVRPGAGARLISYTPTSGSSTLAGNVVLSNSLAFNVASGGALNFQGTVTPSAVGNVRLALDGGGTLISTGNSTTTGANYQIRVGNGTLIIGAGGLTARTGNSGIGHGYDLGVDLNGNIVNAASSILLSNAVTVASSVFVSTTGGNTRTLGLTGAGASTFSGPVDLNNAGVTVAADNASGNATFSGVIANWTGSTAVNNSLTKTGVGTVTLSGASANTYGGLTTVSAGVLNLNKTAGVNAIAGNLTVGNGTSDSSVKLLLSASNQVANSGGQTVTLSGGTIARGGNVSEVFGNLNLTTASFLDYGAANNTGTLSFGTYAPSALLTVQNFLPGNVLTFGSDLTSSINNPSLFSLGAQGFTSSWSSGTSTFTITAIPEPSTYVAAAGMLALFLWPARRRLIKDAKSILGLRPNGRDRIESYRNA